MPGLVHLRLPRSDATHPSMDGSRSLSMEKTVPVSPSPPPRFCLTEESNQAHAFMSLYTVVS